MEAEQRKEKFIALLNELLNETGGVKAKLAQKLEINSSTLSRWVLGQVDPASLDLINFIRLSEIANLSPDELANLIGIRADSEEKVLDRFKNLIKDLLSSQSLEQLGNKLGVTHGAIGGWLSSQRKVNPQKISIGTITAIAVEKGWTLERLLIYLGLKQLKTEKNNLLFKAQSSANDLSLNDQVKLLAWLFDLVQKKVVQEKTLDKVQERKSDRQVCLILEPDKISIASQHLNNLSIYTQLQLQNISIATPDSIPDSLEGFDILIFDINSPQSPCIPLLDSLQFKGDILVFADSSLPDDVRERLLQQATEVILKPVPWGELKDKSYFS